MSTNDNELIAQLASLTLDGAMRRSIRGFVYSIKFSRSRGLKCQVLWDFLLNVYLASVAEAERVLPQLRELDDNRLMEIFQDAFPQQPPAEAATDRGAVNPPRNVEVIDEGIEETPLFGTIALNNRTQSQPDDTSTLTDDPISNARPPGKPKAKSKNQDESSSDGASHYFKHDDNNNNGGGTQNA